MTLDHDLNRAILLLAPAFEARDHAPGTFAEIMRSPGIVWSGASDATIYGDAHVNHAFRAWHDACHIAGEFGFDLEGERMACELQCRQLQTLWPRVPLRLLNIIRAEVMGQAAFYAATGLFPTDQAAFILERIGQ